MSRLPKLFFKLSSFFIERLVYKTKSFDNRELKVMLSSGNYILNSGEANYSFGSLHQAFQEAFSKTNLKSKPIESALILGFGAGSIARILRHELRLGCNITGVELDKEVLHLAHTYFNLSSLNNCEIIQADALDYLEKSERMFDFIAVDLFNELDVPEKFCTESFLHLLKAHLHLDGRVYFNFVVVTELQKQHFNLLQDKFKIVFPNSSAVFIPESNLMLVNR